MREESSSGCSLFKHPCLTLELVFVVGFRKLISRANCFVAVFHGESYNITHKEVTDVVQSGMSNEPKSKDCGR